jgi:hypothetical protein
METKIQKDPDLVVCIGDPDFDPRAELPEYVPPVATLQSGTCDLKTWISILQSETRHFFRTLKQDPLANHLTAGHEQGSGRFHLFDDLEQMHAKRLAAQQEEHYRIVAVHRRAAKITPESWQMPDLADALAVAKPRREATQRKKFGLDRVVVGNTQESSADWEQLCRYIRDIAVKQPNKSKFLHNTAFPAPHRHNPYDLEFVRGFFVRKPGPETPPPLACWLICKNNILVGALTAPVEKENAWGRVEPGSWHLYWDDWLIQLLNLVNRDRPLSTPDFLQWCWKHKLVEVDMQNPNVQARLSLCAGGDRSVSLRDVVSPQTQRIWPLELFRMWCAQWQDSGMAFLGWNVEEWPSLLLTLQWLSEKFSRWPPRCCQILASFLMRSPISDSPLDPIVRATRKPIPERYTKYESTY